MDDGWFGERNDDHAGLGDWVSIRKNSPTGSKPLIDHVNQLGHGFRPVGRAGNGEPR